MNTIPSPSGVIPPPFQSPDFIQGYFHGYMDGAADTRLPLTVQPPALPVVPTYTPDKSYFIAPDGNDKTGDGSQAKPFQNFDHAMQQVVRDRQVPTGPKLAGIFYKAGGSSYHQNSALLDGNIVIGAWGQANVEDRPVITADTNAFLGVHNKTNCHFQNLRVTPLDPAKSAGYGIFTNGWSNVTLDYCEVEGFGLDVCLMNGGGFRLYYNFIGRSWMPHVGRSQGLYTEGALAPDSQCNVFYHNGWNEKDFNINDPSNVSLLMFNHGDYESHASGSTPGVDRFNIYIDNATSGHQARNGGLVEWSVFQSNGNACDVFTDGDAGEIGHCVVFGPTQPGPYWGGGILGQSANQSIHDILFCSDATSEQPAAVTIAPGGSLKPAQATISNISGVWPHAPVALLKGRTATQTNITVRQPKAGEVLPKLMDYFGVTSDDALAEILRKSLHNPSCYAPAIIAWANRVVPR